MHILDNMCIKWRISCKKSLENLDSKEIFVIFAVQFKNIEYGIKQ